MKLSTLCRLLLLACTVCMVVTSAREKKGTAGKVPVPPLSDGGIASLWYREHEFIEKQYGAFDLLDFNKVTYRIQNKGVTDTTWQLTSIGNFLRDGIQYATLARLEGKLDGTLLIMFEWANPSDTTRSHGVFYHSVLSKDQLLIRTKQSGTGRIDTLEFSCADIQRRCGKLYLDDTSDQIVLKVEGQD